MNSTSWLVLAQATQWATISLGFTGLVNDRTYWTMASVASFLFSGYTLMVSHWAYFGIDAASLVICLYMWWRHRNDDDDSRNGKRFKAWVANKLRKFAPVKLRPIERVGANS